MKIFRYFYFHPSWLDNDAMLMNISMSQKKCLTAHLHQFLQMGHIEKIQPRLKLWLEKLQIEPVDGILEPNAIDSWPKLLMTLDALVSKL